MSSMTFAQYLKAKRLTPPDWARLHGFSIQTAHNYLKGRMPAPAHREKFYHACDGMVTMDSFCPFIKRKR